MNSTAAVIQLEIALGDDDRWHFDGWGRAATKPLFSGDGDTLLDALRACVKMVEALNV